MSKPLDRNGREVFSGDWILQYVRGEEPKSYIEQVKSVVWQDKAIGSYLVRTTHGGIYGIGYTEKLPVRITSGPLVSTE